MAALASSGKRGVSPVKVRKAAFAALAYRVAGSSVLYAPFATGKRHFCDISSQIPIAGSISQK